MKQITIKIVTLITLFILSVGIISCVKETDNGAKKSVDKIETPVIVSDVLGNEYRLVSKETKLADGSTVVELWERIKPLDTNRWYMRTLSSIKDSNQIPTFVSIRK